MFSTRALRTREAKYRSWGKSHFPHRSAMATPDSPSTPLRGCPRLGHKGFSRNGDGQSRIFPQFKHGGLLYGQNHLHWLSSLARTQRILLATKGGTNQSSRTLWAIRHIG